MDQPIKGFVVVALGTLGFRLWKCAYLLFLPTQDDNVLSFVRKATDYLVSTTACVTAFRAGHEDFLFHLGWEKGRPALRAKLQNLFSRSEASRANLEFILSKPDLAHLLFLEDGRFEQVLADCSVWTSDVIRPGRFVCPFLF